MELNYFRIRVGDGHRDGDGAGGATRLRVRFISVGFIGTYSHSFDCLSICLLACPI